MKKWHYRAALAGSILAALSACNTERKQECDALSTALKPLDDPKPTSDSVGRLRTALDGLKLDDEPLLEYARTTKSTLEVLSNTLAVKEGPAPPDGTDDVVAAKLKEARTVRDDVVHYCAQ
jgi:hypothetical protein